VDVYKAGFPALTVHVVASSVLLNLRTAIRAWLRSQHLNGVLRQLVLKVLVFVAGRLAMPGPVTFKAMLVGAVGALSFIPLFPFHAMNGAAVLNREITATLGIQARDSVLVLAEEAVGKSTLPPLTLG